MPCMTMFRLKKPVFVTFERNGVERVEAITVVHCRRLDEGEERLDVPELRGFCDRIDIDGWEPVELAVTLIESDVAEAVESAFLTAKWHADHYFAALDADAKAGDANPIDISRVTFPNWREVLAGTVSEEENRAYYTQHEPARVALAVKLAGAPA